MKEESPVQIGLNIATFALMIYGVVLGFKVGFITGLVYCGLVFTPIITAVVHLCTGFQVNLAQILTDFVMTHQNVVGLAAVVVIAVGGYMLLAAWFKIITMFARK